MCWKTRDWKENAAGILVPVKNLTSRLHVMGPSGKVVQVGGRDLDTVASNGSTEDTNLLTANSELTCDKCETCDRPESLGLR